MLASFASFDFVTISTTTNLGAEIAKSEYRLPTLWTTEESEFERVKNFLFSESSRPALRSTQPPIECVPGTLSLGVKRPGREVDHSLPTSAEVKKMWVYTSTPLYAFMA
jgi:hypothetical protein